MFLLRITINIKNKQMKTKNFLSFTFSSSIWRITWVLLFLGLAVFLLIVNPKLSADYWNNWSDQYLAYITLVIAAVIWIGEQYKNWRNNLPKKLNIAYLFKDEKWILKNAPLAGEADIRAWGQSAGRTPFNGGDFFDLAGYQLTKFGVREKREVHYELTIHLTKPLSNEENRISYFDESGKLIK